MGRQILQRNAHYANEIRNWSGHSYENKVFSCFGAALTGAMGDCFKNELLLP
jgi:hypothetical protein